MTFTQDPSAVLDYTIDWSQWLPSGDTITAATWTAESLIPPTQLTLSTLNVGGNLAAATYVWVVTALDASGETTPSNEVTATWVAANGQATLTWTVVPNATGYKVYRGSVAGGENTLVTTITNAGINTYTDTGTAGTAATPPLTNSAALGMTVATTPAPSTTGTETTAFIKGGSAGAVYTITCHITTEQQRQAARTITIAVAEQDL